MNTSKLVILNVKSNVYHSYLRYSGLVIMSKKEERSSKKARKNVYVQSGRLIWKSYSRFQDMSKLQSGHHDQNRFALIIVSAHLASETSCLLNQSVRAYASPIMQFEALMI